MLLGRLIIAGVAGLFTIVATLISTLIWDRWINKPKLIIKPIERPGEEPPAIQPLREKHRAFYHINVKNEGRAPAKNLRPRLAFYKDGRRVCSFSAKWDFNPEPLRYEVIVGGELRSIPEPYLIPQGELIDIPPGGGENFCTLMKYEGEDECYGFSALSYIYIYQGLKNQEWKLNPGRYSVKLDLIGDNVQKGVWLKIECKRWVDVKRKGNMEKIFSYAVVTNMESELSSPLMPLGRFTRVLRSALTKVKRSSP